MRTQKILRVLAVVALGASFLFTSACGTVSGLGEDINKLGRKIETKTEGEGVAGGFGEDLSTLGRKMERKADDVRYGDTY